MVASRVLVSAHRGVVADAPGVENTRAGIERAVATGAEYVELDVRRCGDGTLVLSHDAEVLLEGSPRRVAHLSYDEFAAAAPGALCFEEALAVLAGRAGVHLDLKLRSPDAAYASPEETREVAATELAVGLAGVGNVVVTTGNVRAVRAVRQWSRDRGTDVRVGLTVGGSVAGRPLRQQVRMRWSELFPAPRFAGSGADLVVANHWLALGGVARFARGAGLPLLVWTVDHPVLLRYWMHPGRAWMVTTNRPELALSLRDSAGGDG